MSDRTVELNQAFSWVCEDCGRNNFVMGVTLGIDLGREMISEQRRAEMEGLLEELQENLPAGELGGHWMLQPKHVTCEHCGSTFATEEDDPLLHLEAPR